MRIMITILFSLIIRLSFGQDFRNNLAVKDFLNNLIETKVDTALIYERGDVGRSEPIVLINHDSCFIYGETHFSYVIWRKNNIDFISKLSTHDCYTYDTIQYDFAPIWETYFENKETIRTEKIYLPKYFDGTDTLTIGLDHYSYSQFMFIINNDMVEFEVSDFDLSEIINGKFVNLNYLRNKKTSRNSIRETIDNEVNMIEKKNLIGRKTVYNNVYTK